MTHDAAPSDNLDAPLDWEALARYVAGESSSSERERIKRHLAEHPGDAGVVAALGNAMRILSLREAPEIDVESALERVVVRRDAPEVTPLSIAAQKSRAWRSRGTIGSGWRIASALATAAILVFTVRAVLMRNGGERIQSAPAAPRTYATAVGQRDSLRLPDGGHVVLGPASRLTIGSGFGERVRDVELHGEAYFDIVHDTTRPFVVRVASATIRDVGTSFAVQENGGSVRVVVTSGSVLLQSNDAPAGKNVLGAGDVGTIGADGRIVTAHDTATTPYLSWMRGSLDFRNAPLGDVGNDLQRWYGIVLRVDDSTLARKHLTASFHGDPIDRVLRVIGLDFGASVELRGDTAVLRSTRPR